MNEIKVTQGTNEWFELRIGKITGSNFNNIMKSAKQRELPFNKTQLTYLYSVCAEMFTGVDEEDFKSKWMYRGSELEVFARTAYAMKHLTTVRECGFYTDDIAIGVSPDGVIGDNDKDMFIALEEIDRIQGGIALVRNGKVVDSLQLEYGGLMTNKDVKVVESKIKNMDTIVREMGVNEKVDDPFLSLAFMSLPVIPELKLTDKGLFDVTLFKQISLEVEEGDA